MRVWVLVVGIAIFFSFWAMRGAAWSDVTFNDQARHALNGLAIHDLVNDGAVTQPVSYIRRYFSRWPALSMPYHPPVFPAIEALFYSILGPSHFAARTCVAAFVGGGVVLLFLLVQKTHGSYMAVPAVTAVFSLPLILRLSADVMLEMPAMFFVLASVNFMEALENGWSTRRAVVSALLGGLAVWTKHTVFLGLLPVLVIIGSGRLELFRSRAFWLFTGLFGTAVAALAALMTAAGIHGFSRAWESSDIVRRIVGGISFYVGRLPAVAVVGIVCAAVLAFLLRARVRELFRTSSGLYVTWIVAVVAVVLVVPARDVRYLVFAYPPAIVLCLAAAYELARHLFKEAYARWVPAVTAIAMLMLHVQTPAPWLLGPGEMAHEIMRAGAKRILFAGAANGSFVFAVRAADREGKTAVVRGDKLPTEVFLKDIDAFAHRFGIEYIILERAHHGEAWDYLTEWPTSQMKLERVVPIRSNQGSAGTTAYVFRFLNPSPTPESRLPIRIDSAAQDMTLVF